MKIEGKKEGREGIWLLDPAEASKLIRELPEETVHNFIGSGSLMIGTDWDKSDVIEMIQREGVRIALLFPPNVTMLHQLVICTDHRRYGFDVGKISEDVMEEKEGASQ